MSEIKRLGLRMILWVAQAILRNQLDDEEREELGYIATSLHVVKEEPELWALEPEPPTVEVKGSFARLRSHPTPKPEDKEGEG